jgi:hypothetical protein
MKFNTPLCRDRIATRLEAWFLQNKTILQRRRRHHHHHNNNNNNNNSNYYYYFHCDYNQPTDFVYSIAGFNGEVRTTLRYLAEKKAYSYSKQQDEVFSFKRHEHKMAPDKSEIPFFPAKRNSYD